MGKAIMLIPLAMTIVAYADSWDYQRGLMDGETHRHVTIINPKYSTDQAIDVCINDMVERGEAVNEINLKRALRRMSEGDVCLPDKKSDLNQLIRNAVKKYNMRAQTALLKENPPPKMSDYDTETAYVSAYVSYRVENMTPSEKDQWSKRMGGINSFKREMKNQATKAWRKKGK